MLRKLKWWSSRTKIQAVSDDNLEDLLISLGILDELRAGKIMCVECGEKITLETLQLTSMTDGKVIICCNKPECITKFALEHAGRK
jgi:hypothetical protein